MHKLSLLVIAFLFFGLAKVSAQQGFEVNISGSPAASFLLNSEDLDDDGKDYKGTFGYLAGGTVGYNFTDHFGLSVGAFYVVSGQKFEASNSSALFQEQHRKLEYLRIPVLFKFSGDPYSTFTPFVRFGPHVDFLQDATLKTKDLTGNTTTVDMNNYDVLGRKYDTYTKDPVFGATLELGGFFNITDFVKLSLAFHVSSSFTNIETEDARFVLTSSGGLLSPSRANTFNTLVGGTVGLSFVIGGY